MDGERVHQRSVSPAVEDYAKAIYHLEGQLEGSVSTAALAERLGIRPASVSGMLRKLDDLGYLEYERYRGVRLSADGRLAALTVIRRHRLLELFLATTLGITWDKVHDEAEELEHALSPELCDLIAERLGDPVLDPHGDPIPTRDGILIETRHERLVDAREGTALRVARVSDRDPDVLRELSAHGISLGSVIAINERMQDGALRINVEGADHLLSARVVNAVLVDEAS